MKIYKGYIIKFNEIDKNNDIFIKNCIKNLNQNLDKKSEFSNN